MTIETELQAFYRRHGFGEQIGARPPCTVAVYTGCLLVPLPNIEARRKYLKYHDLHHLVTGYGVGRIGEGEMSAWELGTGSMLASPWLGVMNLIALSTGLVLEPRRMWRAFSRGAAARNLYSATARADVDRGRWPDVDALRAMLQDVPTRVPALRTVEFGAYAASAMAIHAMLAIPAVITRVIADLLLGKTLFEAVKPVRRNDLT